MNEARYFNRRVLWLYAVLVLTNSPVHAGEKHNASNEKELIVVLQTASPAEKAIACKQLAIHGTKEAVPELAKLLEDEQLSSWARIALEAIPDPAADEALRQAADKLHGKLLVGVINSIGVRRDAGAVDQLIGRLNEQDAEVASAAAVSLGHVGNAAATRALRQSLTTAPAAVRNAVAEGCILCAERLVAEGKTKEAAQLYDEVRAADVSKQRMLEAIRGAILARRSDGIPLLINELQSSDRKRFLMALSTSRELPGRDVSDALAAELSRTTPERAELLLYALADRDDAILPSAVHEVATNGPKELRIAAIGVVGRLGDASSMPTLLEIATQSDAELAAAARAALAGLPGEKVDAEIIGRLSKSKGKSLAVLIELVGQRRISAIPALVKAIDHPDEAIRRAAVTALGATAGAKDLTVLIAQVVAPHDPRDTDLAERALQTACTRMPDREACAAELAAAMPRASRSAKRSLLEILGAMGGPTALDTIAAAVKTGDAEFQDTGSRLLGQWMTVDAAPVLLDLAQNRSADKYQVRALRGYIRLARQFAMADRERADICENALDAAHRTEEQKLVLAVLERYPNIESLRVAVKAAELPMLRKDAVRVALTISQQLGSERTDVRTRLATIGLHPVKVEIIKAEFGAGRTQQDVTETLRRQVGDLPLIALSSQSYVDSFGGDPLPGTAKQLKIQYRINGKPGDASFPENAVIVLPMPK
jgi:HEAT repeat protein